MLVADGGSHKRDYNIREEAGTAPEGIRIVIDPTKITAKNVEITLAAMGQRLRKQWRRMA